MLLINQSGRKLVVKFTATWSRDSGTFWIVTNCGINSWVKMKRRTAKAAFRLLTEPPALALSLTTPATTRYALDLAKMSAAGQDTVTLSNLAALAGMVLGTAGSVMSLMNYLRDRPRVRVSLSWDLTPIQDTEQVGEQIGVLSITNVGRRPIFISIAAVEVPQTFRKRAHLVVLESSSGQRLAEGDPPLKYVLRYKDLKLSPYSNRWRQVRGYAEDSAGKRYVSKKPPKSPVPSWVKES